MASRFKNVFPLMVYAPQEDIQQLKDFAHSVGRPVSQIAREAIKMRIVTTENNYMVGFNDGIDSAVRVLNKIEESKMRFPNGKSFGEIVSEEINKQKMESSDGYDSNLAPEGKTKSE